MVKICNKSKSIVNFNTSDLYINCVREKMVFFDKKDWTSSTDKGLAFIGLVKLSYKTNTGQIVPLSYNEAPERAFDENGISLRRCDPTYSFRTCSSSSINPSVDVSYGVTDSIRRRSFLKDEEYPSRDIDVVEFVGNPLATAGVQTTSNNDGQKHRRQEKDLAGHQERRTTENVPLLQSTDVFCTKKCTDNRKPERPHEGPLSIIFSVDSLLRMDHNSAADHGKALADDTRPEDKPSLIECITISKSLLGRSRLDQASLPHDSKEAGNAELYQNIPLSNIQDLIKELVDNYIAKKRKDKIARSKRRSPHGTSAMHDCRSKIGYVLDSTSGSGSNLLLDSLEESDSGNINKKRGECDMSPSLKQLMQVMMYKRDGSCHPIYSDRNNYKRPKDKACKCSKQTPEKQKRDDDDVLFISVPVNKLHTSAVTLMPEESQEQLEPKKPSIFQRMRGSKKTKQDANEVTTEDGVKPSLYEVTVKGSNSAVTHLNDGRYGFNTVVNVTCPHHSSSSDDSECSRCCKHYHEKPTTKPSKIPLKKREVGERSGGLFKRRRRTDSVSSHRTDSTSNVKYISSSTSPVRLLQNDACQRCCTPNNAGYAQWAPYQPSHHQLSCPHVSPQYKYCDLCSNGILHNGAIDHYHDDYDYAYRERRPSLTVSENPKRSASKTLAKKDVRYGTNQSSQVHLEPSQPPQKKTPSRRFSIFNRSPKEDRKVSLVKTTSETFTVNDSNKPVMFDKATNVDRDHWVATIEIPLDRSLIETPKDFSTNTEPSGTYHHASEVNFETPQSILETDQFIARSLKTNKGVSTVKAIIPEYDQSVKTNKYLHEEPRGTGCCSGHFCKSKPSNASIKQPKSHEEPQGIGCCSGHFSKPKPSNGSIKQSESHEKPHGIGCCSGHFSKPKPSNASVKQSKSRFFPEKKPKQCSKGTCNCARDEKCISCACPSAAVNYAFTPPQRQPERASQPETLHVDIEVGPATGGVPLEDFHLTSAPIRDYPVPQIIQQPEVDLHAVGDQTAIRLRSEPSEVETQNIVLSSEHTYNLPPRPVASLRILYPQKQPSTITSRYKCDLNIRGGKTGAPETLILRDSDTSAPAYSGKVKNYVIKMYPEGDTTYTRSGKTIKRLARKMNELEGVYNDTLQRFQDKRSRKVRKHVIKRYSVGHSKALRMVGDPWDRSQDQERRILLDVAGGVDLVLGKLKELNLIMNNCCH